MPEQQTLTIDNTFKYKFDSPLKIEDLIKALEGYKGLVSTYLPDIVTNITGGKVEKIDVLVTKIEHSSLKECFQLVFSFRNPEQKEKFIEGLRNLVGTNDIDEGNYMKGISKLIITGAIASLLYVAFKKITNDNIIITNNINIINAAPDHLSGPDLVDIVETTISGPSKHKKIQQDAQKILAPTHANGGSIILGDEDNTIIFPQKMLAEIPKDTVHELSTERYEEHQDVDIHIRAADRDKPSGWYVVIDNLVPKRKRLLFNENNPIDLSKLANNETIRADITLVKRLNSKGNKYEVKEVVLDKVITDDE